MHTSLPSGQRRVRPPAHSVRLYSVSDGGSRVFSGYIRKLVHMRQTMPRVPISCGSLSYLGGRRLVSIYWHRAHQCFVFTSNHIFNAICHFLQFECTSQLLFRLLLGLTYARVEFNERKSTRLCSMLTVPLTKHEHDLLGEFSYKYKKHLEAKRR